MKQAVPAGLFLAIPLAASCASLLDLNPGDYGTDASVTCGLSAGSADCQACIASQCCDQAAACAGNAGCAAYESCLLACGSDYACRGGCLADPAAAYVPSIPALDQCISAQCGGVCGLQCGLVAENVSPRDAAAACLQCFTGSPAVCSAAEACARDLECTAVAECTARCSSIDCLPACGAGMDAGIALATSLQTSVAGACLAACDYGSNWDCLGKVTLPVAKAPETTLTVTLVDFASKAGIPGLTVRACAVDDPACLAPVAPAVTTDAQGMATVTLATGFRTGRAPGYGFGGSLDLAAAPTPGDASADGSTTPAYLETLAFLPSPLSEPSTSLTFYVVSAAQWHTLAFLGGSITLDPSRGGIIALATDCALSFAKDVEMSADPSDDQTRLLYAANSSVSTVLPAGGSGAAFFLNVPAAPSTTLTATPRGLGRASRVKGIFVRPGAISTIQLTPN